MAQWEPILDKIAYPRHVAWVPLPIFFVNLAFFSFNALLVTEGIGDSLPDSVPEMLLFGAGGVSAAIHAYIARRFRKDPFIAKVWYSKLFPSDWTRPGTRGLLRRATVKLRRYPGRSFT